MTALEPLEAPLHGDVIDPGSLCEVVARVAGEQAAPRTQLKPRGGGYGRGRR
jgi:hypothetical protein